MTDEPAERGARKKPDRGEPAGLPAQNVQERPITRRSPASKAEQTAVPKEIMVFDSAGRQTVDPF